MDILDKRVAFATTSHRVPVKINEFKFAEWLEDLLDIGLGEVEMERPNIKPTCEQRSISGLCRYEGYVLHATVVRTDTRRQMKTVV